MFSSKKKIQRYAWKLQLPKTQNELLWSMALESAAVYNAYVGLWKSMEDKTKLYSHKEQFPERKFLHSQSYQGSYEQAANDLKSYFSALEAYKKSPSKFTGKPRIPSGNKFISTFVFKKAAIRAKGKELLFSTAIKDQPVSVRWKESLPKPIYATIKMERGEWFLQMVFEEEIVKELMPQNGEVMGIDLGVKRIATTFDGENVTIYSGKKIMSLNRLRNKKASELHRCKTKYKNGSRKQKRVKKGIRRQMRRIARCKNDILEKTASHIVKDCKAKSIPTIAVGDCTSTHNAPNCGKKNNQKISEASDQQLFRKILHKFSRIGGTTKVVSEAYSSQECPSCGKRHKPSNRDYKCSCGFSYDRDGVGSINIRDNALPHDKKYRSEDNSGRSGGLTPPIGVKYRPNLSYRQDCPSVKSCGERGSKLFCQRKLALT